MTEALYTNTALRAWKLVIAQLDQMFSSMSDDELQREVAPGRNRVFYLMGHLTAVHDRLLGTPASRSDSEGRQGRPGQHLKRCGRRSRMAESASMGVDGGQPGEPSF